MVFDEIPEFERDVKQLLKKYRSLQDDLKIVKRVLEILPDERPPFSYRLENLGIQTCVIKVKKIACKALKGKGVQSGLRLVYAYYPLDQKIVFIELFHKNEKPLEDRNRILKYID
jgi:hypothetical protein